MGILEETGARAVNPTKQAGSNKKRIKRTDFLFPILGADNGLRQRSKIAGTLPPAQIGVWLSRRNRNSPQTLDESIALIILYNEQLEPSILVLVCGAC